MSRLHHHHFLLIHCLCAFLNRVSAFRYLALRTEIFQAKKLRVTESWRRISSNHAFSPFAVDAVERGYWHFDMLLPR
jgi:hypothetical protein